MAHLALEFGLPLLALPGGTFNHFARAAGIETVDLGIDALQAGVGVAASVGELTTARRSTTVLNVASIGIYPDFVAERARRRPRLGKWIGGVAATWRELRDAEPIDIVIEGRRARVWSVFASVGRNTPGQVATMQRRTLSDDVLDVRVLHARGSRAQAVAALSFGTAFASGAARTGTAAPGIRHRADHRDRDRDLGATARRRGDVLRARRRAGTPPRGRRGRPLHAPLPDRPAGSPGLRPSRLTAAHGSSLRCMRMPLAADATIAAGFVPSKA